LFANCAVNTKKNTPALYVASNQQRRCYILLNFGIIFFFLNDLKPIIII